MQVRTARLVVALGMATVLAAAGCGSKTTDKPALSIKPVVTLDSQGNEVAPADPAAVANPAGDGKAVCAGYKVALAGALTGDDAALGQNALWGVKLALAEHNQANPNCKVEVREFDTEGKPDRATTVVGPIISDQSVLALIGPVFSGETNSTGGQFEQARLPFLTPSATRPDLSTKGWTNFFRGLGNDSSQGVAAAKYLTGKLAAKKVCVIDDSTDYGTGLSAVMKAELGPAFAPSCAGSVKKKDTDFAATVSQVKSAAPDAVFYAGYFPEAAPLVTQLRQGGYKGLFASGDGSNDINFVKKAGDSAKDAILTCPCVPGPESFNTKYQALAKQAPGIYSVEGYDLTTIVLKAIDSGVKDRAALQNFVRNYNGQGVGKLYKWNPQGELEATRVGVYKVG